MSKQRFAEERCTDCVHVDEPTVLLPTLVLLLKAKLFVNLVVDLDLFETFGHLCTIIFANWRSICWCSSTVASTTPASTSATAP